MISRQEAPMMVVWLLLSLVLALATIRLHLGPIQIPHIRSYLAPLLWVAYWLFQITRWW